MVTKSILQELDLGKTYTGEQLKQFIAYNRVGSIIFCKDTRICSVDPEAIFVVEEILEGYINKRRNDYKNHYDARQKIYIVCEK